MLDRRRVLKGEPYFRLLKEMNDFFICLYFYSFLEKSQALLTLAAKYGKSRYNLISYTYLLGFNQTYKIAEKRTTTGKI